MDFAFLKLIFFRKVAFSSKLGNKDSSGVVRIKAEEGGGCRAAVTVPREKCVHTWEALREVSVSRRSI